MRSINEEIEVVAWFKEGFITPVRFKWKNKVIVVDKVLSKERIGSTIYNNLTIKCQTMQNNRIIEYDLLYETDTYKWTLKNIY